MTEGGRAYFAVTVSENPTSPSYATGDGTATASSAAIGGADYYGRSGTLTFNPGGPRTHYVAVTTRDDSTDENNETFELQLSNATGATTGTAEAVTTIVDNDNAPKITIQDASTVEGNPTTGSPTKTITFVVRLNRVSANAVTTNWATRNGSGSTRALAGSDYVAASGTITIPAGSTQTTVTVTIKKDRTREPAEHFFVGLTGLQNTSFGDGTGKGTITNDDR